MRRFSRWLLLFALSAPGIAHAQELHDEVPLPWTFNVYFENDLFGETDQNYTNGVRMSWVSPDTDKLTSEPLYPDWLQDLNRQLRFFNRSDDLLEHNVVLSLGQLMYTPSSTERYDLVVNERPYAGYLYGGIAYHTRSDDQLDIVELNIGMVGPAALGHETQDFIHDLRGFEKYNGWDKQLRNELGLQLIYEHKERIFKGTVIGTLSHDFIAHGGASLGNVATYLNFGGEYRIGWQLPDDFGTSAVRTGGDNSTPGRHDFRRLSPNGLFHGLHAFFSMDGRLVARDIFLDGNTFRDSHSVDKESAVADFSLGFSFLTGRWKVSFAHVFRTREFKRQPHHHKYGSMSLSYSL
ncbi:MAG: lipid A deacylase LpxR family protein [Gammaproteobacteria bacterium]|nr:lipid A deacylase LpxR family protein [Gammaproteobacteria bacterium]MBQ0839303.1 lipid A deacylase LpxR family protein [Gammaproteobacteria bacterium]